MNQEPAPTVLPKILPAYTIEKLDEPPFSVRWEGLMGWEIIPRLGEEMDFALYDQPEGVMTEYAKLKVVGRASIHGIEGVEIRGVDYYIKDGACEITPHQFVAQMTDTHVRFLAHGWTQNGVHQLSTFLDGDTFGDNWGYGPDNCGKEIDYEMKGRIREESGGYHTDSFPLMDIVGRYKVTIGGVPYDTVCILDCETYDDGVLAQQFIDQDGRLVLWRHFNAPNWRGRDWEKELPDNDRLVLNGRTYVHWYDSINTYVFG